MTAQSDSEQPLMDTVDYGAPIILVDNIPTFGFYNGIFSMTLAAGTSRIEGGQVRNEQRAVAYLRGNVAALFAMKATIEQILLLATPTDGGEN